jgi:hypothetical protein
MSMEELIKATNMMREADEDGRMMVLLIEGGEEENGTMWRVVNGSTTNARLRGMYLLTQALADEIAELTEALESEEPE